ncbi:MAG: sulfatase, partial [Cyanobacteria bacterium P01_A01_bin.135]
AVWLGNYKLIETGNHLLELYDVHQDPTEGLNLSAVLPEDTEVLQDYLDAFSGENVPVGIADRAPGFDDPEVQRRLRDLGYLED